MKALSFALALLLAALPAPVNAQSRDSSNPAVGTLRQLWQQAIGYITTAAEELPEAKYSYRPTDEVRSFGQVIGHVAGAQYLFCSAALGESGRAEDEIERSRTTKAELVAALKASTEYCARAYAQTDKDAQGAIKLFGQDRTRLFALGLNATHDAEHYGSIITYLRLNGIVPPSSRRGS